MRDIRTDFYDPSSKLTTAPSRLVVKCLGYGCSHAVLMDPRPVFGARPNWPAAGRSERFRCRCGSRETELSFTVNTALADGPISADAIRMWI